MLYANDEIFNIGYNKDLDRLQIKKEKKHSKIKKAIYENKIITTLAILFIMFCLLNCVLVFTFMDLLKNI